MGRATTFVGAIALAGCGRIDFDAGDAGDAGVQEPNLVAYYPFDVLSQGLSPDATGHGHDATCTDCPTIQPSPHGNAVLFAGGMQRLDVPGAPDLETLTAFTVTAWIRVDANPVVVGCAFNKGFGSGDQNSWQLCVRANRSPLFAVSGTGAEIYSPQVLVLGRWHHAAIRWTGTSMALTLDGIDVISANAGDSFDGSPLHFGSDIDFGAQYAAYVGYVDELRIYDRALDITEIAALAGS